MIIEIQYAELPERFAGTPLHEIQIGGIADSGPWKNLASNARTQWKFQNWQILINGLAISLDDPKDIQKLLDLPPLPSECSDLEFAEWPLGPIADRNREG